MTRIKDYTEVFDIRGDTIKVTSKRKVNKLTNKLVFDEYLDNIATVKALKIYRKRYNIISPKQIKELRKKYGLSQKELSKILDCDLVTIKAYEKGLLPSAKDNRILRTLINNTDLTKRLLESKKVNKH